MSDYSQGRVDQSLGDSPDLHIALIGKIWWCIILTLSLAATLFDSAQMKKVWEVYAKVTLGIIIQNVLVVAVVIGVSIFLYVKVPTLRWSWLSLFRGSQDSGQDNSSKIEGGNINLIPLKVKYFGLLFALLLFVNLPYLALQEEKMFRQGTQSWGDAILRSLVFGFAHCIAGVPLVSGFGISLAGIWFSHQYFVGGVPLSSLHHTTYNAFLLSGVSLVLLIEHIVDFFKRDKETVEQGG